MVCILLAPSDSAVSRASGATPLRAEMVSPAMMGAISATWPTMMAAGENRMPSTPNGPSLEKVMNTSNPTNTVGILKRVCMALTSIVLPRKLWKCIRLPVGMKISAAMDVETEDMSSVLPVMLNTSRSSRDDELDGCEKAVYHQVQVSPTPVRLWAASRRPRAFCRPERALTIPSRPIIEALVSWLVPGGESRNRPVHSSL